MAYNQGGLIEATDFNTLRSTVIQVFSTGFGNRGYGQVVPTNGLVNIVNNYPAVVSGGVTIGSDEWTQIRNMIERSALHQGTAATLNPPENVLEVGDLIVAHDGVTDPDDIFQMASDIDTNRLNVNPDGFSMTTIIGAASQTTTNSWNSSGITRAQFAFSTDDEARYFFNAGGEIRVTITRTGGTAPATFQNNSWSALLADLGTVTLRADDVLADGLNPTLGSVNGYYALGATAPGTRPDAATLLASASVVGGSYDTNTVEVNAWSTGTAGVNGGNRENIQVEVALFDNATGSPDLVDGTLVVRWDVVYADEVERLEVDAPVATVPVQFDGSNPS